MEAGRDDTQGEQPQGEQPRGERPRSEQSPEAFVPAPGGSAQSSELAASPKPRLCRYCGEAAEPYERFCHRCSEPLPPVKEEDDPDEPVKRSDHLWAAALFVSAAFACTYRVLDANSMLQTYACFIGLPLMVGMLTAYLIHPKSGCGSVLKITALVLCVISPLLGEGFICVVMAAPLVFVMALVGYAIFTALERSVGRGRSTGCLSLILLPFVVAWRTATPRGIAHPATNVVTDSIVISAPPGAVWRALTCGTGAPGPLPAFLNLGFPRPKDLQRDAGGTTRVTFDPGSEPWPGTNVIVTHETRSADRSHVTYTVVDDGTKLARWMTFREFAFAIEPDGSGGCRITQTTYFRQRMQPGFYWNPVQIFAMHRMQGFVLGNLKRRAEGTEESESQGARERDVGIRHPISKIAK